MMALAQTVARGVALAAPCREDVTWRWVAVLGVLLMLLVFWVSVSLLHDIAEANAGRVEWRDKP